MFEEISIWSRENSKVAIRYVGFRNLDTGKVAIAFANYIAIDESRDISADEIIAAQGTLESFLNMFPADIEIWKSTASEAVASFIEKNSNM